MSTELIRRCRALLEETTPLRGDCGLLCGCACCASLPGEQTGMLLFPGEEALYEGRPGYRLQPTGQGPLLLCDGDCQREERPLSCRLFPLLPVIRGGEVRVAKDARALAVCPLHREPLQSLDPAFIEAVRAVGRLLTEDAACKAFLQRLTEENDSLIALQKRFG